jgi:hypothetical protein
VLTEQTDGDDDDDDSNNDAITRKRNYITEMTTAY